MGTGPAGAHGSRSHGPPVTETFAHSPLQTCAVTAPSAAGGHTAGNSRPTTGGQPAMVTPATHASAMRNTSEPRSRGSAVFVFEPRRRTRLIIAAPSHD